MTDLFETLQGVSARPEPFEYYTAEKLWTDEHTSRQMLAYHLNQDVDLSSRKLSFIDRSVEWITDHFEIGAGKKVADFGCGPGLYTTRLAERGADVTGIDFSQRSIDYAQETASKRQLPIHYVNRNYLDYESAERFDLILMIMCDYCALSLRQRSHLLRTFKRHLKPEGRLLLDVHSLAAFEQREEATRFEFNLLEGFWAPGPYYGFLNTFKYEEEKVVLDKYTIVEPDRTRTICNWLQYFSPASLESEFATCGFSVESFLENVAGTPFNPNADEYAVIAKHR